MNALREKITTKVLRICVPLAVTVAAGCTVGPDYVRPEISLPGDWHSRLEGGLTGKTIDPNTLASWWTRLGDPQLSSLIERAVAGNLGLATTRSRVRESRARRYSPRCVVAHSQCGRFSHIEPDRYQYRSGYKRPGVLSEL